jgi:hypothetical protein
LDFSNIKPKIASKANQSYKLKRQTKRNNGNSFGLFVFWKGRNKNKNNKESKTWIYKVPIKYDM